MEDILRSFAAFNNNALENLKYLLMNNLWFLLILGGAITSTVLYLKEEIVSTVREEQRVI